MSYAHLIDQDSNLILYEDMFRCFGIENHILLSKILGWQKFNERAGKTQYKRDDVYWMPFRGKDVTGDGIGNVNYIKSVHNKVRDLIDYGIVSEHMEPPKRGSKPVRWVRVDLSAYEAFVALWFESGQPNSQKSGKKAKESYKDFLDAWGKVKHQYVGATADETDNKMNDRSGAEANRNKLIADYIKVWQDAQTASPAKPRNEYVITFNRATVGALIDKGVTRQDVHDYVSARPFYVTMSNLNNNIMAFVENRKPKATGTMQADVKCADDAPQVIDNDVNNAIDDLLEAI